MSAARKVLTGIFLGIVLLLALGDAFDLVEYWRHPSSYGFGTEVAGFRYLSPSHFLGSIAMTISGAVFAVLAPKFIGSSRAVISARAGVTLLLVALRYL
jgi:hypothetical protein